MLCGYSHFRSNDPQELIRETEECRLTFHDRYWKNVSSLAKDFIKALVNPDPLTRLSAEEALRHPVRLSFRMFPLCNALTYASRSG